MFLIGVEFLLDNDWVYFDVIKGMLFGVFDMIEYYSCI